jgi:tripartite-type tricarboxylate transporter receptor subunit TctC
LMFFPCIAFAQGYPAKPIRMVVAFPAGGSTDLAARALGEKLSTSLGEPVVIENKPGASGNIGAEAVARSAPDGYTLFMAATSFATAPAFFPKLGWDPVKDFAPVSLVATVPIVLVVNPELPVRTAAELIAYAKANPGRLNIASPGQATLIRLAGEMFKQAAGIDWVTVHYKGGPPAVQDVLSGNAQVMLAQVSDVISLIRAQKLRALAVTSGGRSAVAPELPTLAEGPLPGFSVSTWQALVAPAGTPREIVQRLNAEVVKALALPDVKERFLSFGTDAASSTPQELGRLLAGEVSRIGRIAKDVGAKLD